MNNRDPFSSVYDDDKTVIRPAPGGRRPSRSASPPAQPPAAPLSDLDAPIGGFSGVHPLTSLAGPLLAIVPKLRELPFHHAAHTLQEQLVAKMKDFEEDALSRGASQRQMKIASYFLCAFIDDTVLNTPWGSQSNWAQHSLSIQLHKRNVGGEEFFQILQQLLQQPAQNLDLIELAYLCLSLGFEGKYRNQDRGLRALDELRKELYLVLQRMQGDIERDLSMQWQGVRDLRNPLTRYVPLWVHVTIACLLLTLVYLGFSHAINSASDRVYNQISALPREVMKPSTRTPEQESPPPPPSRSKQVDRFRSLLAREIAQHMVEVLDGPILRITNAFPSGSDQVLNDFRPMLAKIAGELKNDNSRIAVIGHTDNRPIRGFSARFKSNWDLSVARAKSVASVLEASAALGDRMLFEGRADREPIVSNDTEQNQALNRRIDIHLR